jgi:integrase
MASLSRDKSGRVSIQFVHPTDKKRRTIRAGKMSERDGEALKRRVEDLAAALAANQTLDEKTQLWLAGIGDTLRDKLAAVGLTQRAVSAQLGVFLDAYIAKRTDVDASTVTNLKIGAKRLTGYFGADRELRSISAGDCDEWMVWLKEKYAGATVGKSVKWAKQFFRAAVRKKLIPENPFEDVKPPSMANEARKRFIDRATTALVMDACPNAEWRLTFALSRFGGLRCPSEHLALEWTDVDWEKGRFLVRSPKTGNRWVPIFAELRPYLDEAFEAAPEGATSIFPYRVNASQLLRKDLLRILRRAGVTPWPRLFHNLRATRETELAAEYPLHVVCAWIGNTERIAAKHYLQVTDADFERAAKSDAPALQNRVQHDTAPSRIESQESSEVKQTCGFMREGARRCGAVHGEQMTPTGLQLPVATTLPAKDLRNEAQGGAAKSGAAPSRNVSQDADLVKVVEAWPTLPKAVREQILALVDSGSCSV